MLITKVKEREKLIAALRNKNIFVFKCFGCKEVYFPEEEIDSLLEEAGVKNRVARVDYLCREEFAEKYYKKYENILKDAEAVIVFSCGVGIQVLAKILPDIPVIPACDTHYINGFQGLTAQDADCQQCGECWLNITGGICPITSCAKGLLNGPCGGAKEGKCEVNKNMDCGWVLIYERLKLLKEEGALHKKSTNIRDYRLIIEGGKRSEE
ncbi:MAG: methylenetetrahydrofolate reductase C-terminal domain-containing protein [Candidatus Ratteibacteria bacterium]